MDKSSCLLLMARAVFCVTNDDRDSIRRYFSVSGLVPFNFAIWSVIGESACDAFGPSAPYMSIARGAKRMPSCVHASRYLWSLVSSRYLRVSPRREWGKVQKGCECGLTTVISMANGESPIQGSSMNRSRRLLSFHGRALSWGRGSSFLTVRPMPLWRM